MWNNLKHASCFFVVLSLFGTHCAFGAVGDGDPNWNPEPHFPFDSDLMDDFDSPVDDDHPVTWHNTSRITMAAQEGSLTLSPPLRWEGFAPGLIEVWKNGRPIMVSNTSIQAVIRLGNGNSFVGVYTNTQDGTGDGDAYVGNIFPDGEIRVSRFSGEPRSVNTPLDPVNSDVALQFDTIGDRITLRAWAVDQPDAVYSVTWKDEQGPRPLGYMGLGVGAVGPDAVNGQVLVRSFQVSRVQPIFLEDFEDGNASDGNPVTWLTIDATGTVSDGSYVLTTNGDGGVEADEFDSIGDVSLRATARGLTRGSGDWLNLFSHRQPDGRSHWVLVTPWGLHTGSGLPGRAGVIGTVFQPGAFNPFTGDLNIQFDVKGSELSLTVWQLGKAKPSQPQLTSTAPSLPPGRVGFATNYRQIAIRSFDAIQSEALQAGEMEESTASSAKLTHQRTEDVVYGRRFGSALTLDVFQAAETAPSDLHVKKNLADGDVLTIRQTWSQEPGGFVRTADALVPSGAGPFPVVIILHGMGGDSKFAQFICAVTPRFNDVIRVAPNGYLKSWNIDATPSKAPDVAFMRDLIELIKTHDNVDAQRIYLLGFSNGSGLVNRLLIELDGAAFQKAGCVVAQMIAKMYHHDSFWYNPTGSNDYDQKITPAPGRRIISINGTADPIVPYLGGDSAAGTRFLDCQESLYRFAQAMGETGPQTPDADGIPGNRSDSDPWNDYSPQFVKYSYLEGQVVHYKLMGGGHGLAVEGHKNFGPEAMKLIADFFFE